MQCYCWKSIRKIDAATTENKVGYTWLYSPNRLSLLYAGLLSFRRRMEARHQISNWNLDIFQVHWQYPLRSGTFSIKNQIGSFFHCYFVCWSVFSFPNSFYQSAFLFEQCVYYKSCNSNRQSSIQIHFYFSLNVFPLNITIHLRELTLSSISNLVRWPITFPWPTIWFCSIFFASSSDSRIVDRIQIPLHNNTFGKSKNKIR